MRWSRGVTLPELLTVMAITGVLLAVAVPSFTDLVARRRVEGVTTELMQDIKYTRSQAINVNASVRLQTNATGYTVTNVASSVEYKSVTLPAGVTVTQPVITTFTAFRGFPDGATTMTVGSSSTSAQLRITTDSAGSLSICTPSGLMTGYLSC